MKIEISERIIEEIKNLRGERGAWKEIAENPEFIKDVIDSTMLECILKEKTKIAISAMVKRYEKKWEDIYKADIENNERKENEI